MSTFPETPGESIVRWEAFTMPGAEMARVFVCKCSGSTVPAAALSFSPAEPETDGSVKMAVPIKSAAIPRPMPMDQDVPFF